jgi:hypothetical protein
MVPNNPNNPNNPPLARAERRAELAREYRSIGGPCVVRSIGGPCVGVPLPPRALRSLAHCRVMESERAKSQVCGYPLAHSLLHGPAHGPTRPGGAVSGGLGPEPRRRRGVQRGGIKGPCRGHWEAIGGPLGCHWGAIGGPLGGHWGDHRGAIGESQKKAIGESQKKAIGEP